MIVETNWTLESKWIFFFGFPPHLVRRNYFKESVTSGEVDDEKFWEISKFRNKSWLFFFACVQTIFELTKTEQQDRTLSLGIEVTGSPVGLNSLSDVLLATTIVVLLHGGSHQQVSSSSSHYYNYNNHYFLLFPHFSLSLSFFLWSKNWPLHVGKTPPRASLR